LIFALGGGKLKDDGSRLIAGPLNGRRVVRVVFWYSLSL